MKETLFLITDHFPYGTGEPFLEDELPFLSEAFDEVILLARNKGKGMRPVPANVRVVPLRKRLSLCSSLSIYLSFTLRIKGNEREAHRPVDRGDEACLAFVPDCR